jgi:hypothetical protein
MHFPEFSLITGAYTCFSSLSCLFVEPERKIKEVVPDFSCINILFGYL